MKELVRKDLKYNWHPYTQMKDCRRYPPLVVSRAKGVKIYGSGRKWYYDTVSSWWCNVHGHNHPFIKRAVKRQLDRFEHVLFAGFTHEPAVKLAEKLVKITPPGLDRVFYSDDGSTAVEVALKMSYQYWRNTGKPGKKRFVSLENGYHGDTIGAMNVSGVGLFSEVFSGLFFPSYKVPSPYCYRCPAGRNRRSCSVECIMPLEKLLKRKHGEIAALVMEPLVQAAGGMIIYPAEYLEKAAGLAKRYGVHLILDEVATGFGRTGRMFACDHVKGVRPDFMCLSKGITSGYLPMGVTMATSKVYNAFYAEYGKKKTFYHGHTQTANAVAASAALAVLELFDREDTLRNVRELEPLLAEGLARISELDIAGNVRSIGLIGAVELVKDRRTKKPFSFGDRAGFRIYNEGLKKNLILRPLGDVIYLFLPLCIRKRELEDILDRTYRVIKTAGVR